MWGDDEPVAGRTLLEPGDEECLVRRPAGTGDEDGVAGGKLLYEGQGTGGALDVQYSVETCVADDGDVVLDVQRGKEVCRLLVLDEEMRDFVEHLGVAAAVPAEEDLVGTEDAADGVHGDSQSLAPLQVVLPELILDEEQHLGFDEVEE